MNAPDSQKPASAHDELQRRGGLLLRTLPILLIPMLALSLGLLLIRMLNLLPAMPAEGPPFSPPAVLIGTLIFISALILLVRLRRPTLSALLLIGMWTLLTTVGLLFGGLNGIEPALLIIPIVVAGLLIDGWASVSLALLASVLLGGIAWMQINGLILPEPGRRPFPGELLPLLSFAFWAGLFWTIALLTSLLAGGQQRALKQSRAHAEQLAALSAELEQRVTNQTAALLAQSREAARMEERTRLAREIHDTLAQGLTGIVVQLGAAQRAHEQNPPEVAEHLNLAQRLAREALAEARSSVWNLRAPLLERGDLADALRTLAQRPQATTLPVYFEQRGPARPLSPGIESALLRVAQEGLSNAARHSGASQVQLRLAYLPESVELTITDNGSGFEHPDQLPAAPGAWGGFGLTGMRERLSALGGWLELYNEQGAVVRANIPTTDTGMR